MTDGRGTDGSGTPDRGSRGREHGDDRADGRDRDRGGDRDYGGDRGGERPEGGRADGGRAGGGRIGAGPTGRRVVRLSRLSLSPPAGPRGSAADRSDAEEADRAGGLERGERAPGRGTDRVGDRGVERAGDRGVERAGDRGVERAGDRGAERAGDRGADRAPDRHPAAERPEHPDRSSRRPPTRRPRPTWDADAVTDKYARSAAPARSGTGERPVRSERPAPERTGATERSGPGERRRATERPAAERPEAAERSGPGGRRRAAERPGVAERPEADERSTAERSAAADRRGPVERSGPAERPGWTRVAVRSSAPEPAGRAARDAAHEDETEAWLLPGEDDRPAPTSSAASSGSSRTSSRSSRDEEDDDGSALTELLPGGSRPRGPASGSSRRRRWLWPAVAGVLVLALVGGVFFARDLFGVFFPADFDGPGTGRVVVQVTDGDSVRAVGEELTERGVVASARAFGSAAEDDPRGRGIQPGFYELRRQMSAQQAVEALLDPATRLGRLEIRGGTQLDDTVGAGNAIVPGVLALIAQATCLPDESGGEQCRTVDELRSAMTSTDPSELGVPPWALDDVRRAEPARRLEGLLAPGTYDVRPGASAVEALGQVVRESASTLASSGIESRAGALGMTPYQVLVVASIVEKEGVQQDFGKIARVIDNRLPIPMRLQMDSTINYPLDRQTLLTTPFDRARPGPYNTYLNLGLPPTPIAAVSAPALRAATDPDPGGWVYFVKCQTDGRSCFAVTPEEHDANRRLAQARGVY